MRFMNEYDLEVAYNRFWEGNTPNRFHLVLVVHRLRQWADENSDGWAHWPKPGRAASIAMSHIESRTNRENDQQEREDITDAEFRRALAPIKAFLTRQNVADEIRREILSVA